MAHKILQHNGLTWYHFINVDEGDLVYMDKTFKFHPLTIKDIRSTLENPKWDLFSDYAFGVFHFPEVKIKNNRLMVHEMDMYIGKNYVITIQESKFRMARDLFYKIARNSKAKEEAFGNGSNYLFYYICNTLVNESFEPTISYIGKRIKILEDEIYDAGRLKGALISIGVLRRNVLNFKKIITPQLKLFHNLTTMDNNVISVEYSEYFDDIDDYIERAATITSNHQEIIEGLNLTSESLISFRTNEVIKLLTIISVAILPLALFSGLYGMNIDLPFQEQSSIVWMLFGVLFSFIVVLLFFFNQRNK